MASGEDSIDWLDWATEIAGRTVGMDPSPSARAALLSAEFVVAEEELERRLREPARHYWRRIWRAVVLSSDVETCDALLAGQRVPLDHIDTVQLSRFPRRRRAS